MREKVLILGAGPAGCSAALTLRLRNIEAAVLYAGGGALEKARRVDNYPGLPEMPGSEMLSAFRRQAERAGARFMPGLARYIQRTKKGFTVLVGEEMLDCQSILLCTGVGRIKCLPGEEELLGQGVSYCATCDGMLYRGGHVAVIAQDARAHEDARFLQSICRVDYYMEKPHAAPEGMEVRPEKPLSLERDGAGVRVVCKESAQSYDCVFVLRPAVALGTLLPTLAMRGDAVVVDEGMRTSIDGVFAAGDVTGAPYQAARAVGQGNTAALSIAKYLSEKGE